jgi:hypothetical protein
MDTIPCTNDELQISLGVPGRVGAGAVLSGVGALAPPWCSPPMWGCLRPPPLDPHATLLQLNKTPCIMAPSEKQILHM